MNWTGVTHNPTFDGSSVLEVYGSLTLGTGMVFNFAGNVSFEATVPGKTITSSGVPISSSLTFNGIGGSWTLQDALTVLNTLYLNNGILSTNNQIVNATAFYSYTSSARTLNLGASVFNLSGSYQMWYILNPSSLTLNAGASTINITSNDNQQLFVGGGLNYNNISFVGKGQIYDNNIINDVSFGGDAEIRGNNTFHNVTFGGAAFLYSASVYNDVTIAKQAEIFGNNTFNNLSFSPGYTYTLEADQTQTILGSLTVNGNCGALIGIVKSSSIGNQATISKASGNVVVSYVTLKDINATGGAAFTANNAIDLGNNTGWTINTLPSKSLYWVGNGGNWDDGNHWSLTSGGSPSGCSPTPVDNVFFDANSFSTAGQSVTINVPTAYCNNMNWTGATNNPSIEGTYTSVFKIYGSLTLAAGMAFNFVGDILFEATATGKTITTAGVPVNTTLRFDGIGGGWTLQDNLSTSLIFLNSGSLNTNSKTVTAYAFYSSSNFTKALTMGSSVVNLTGSFQIWNIDNPATMTLDAGTSTINSTYTVGNQQLFEGGGFTYNDLTFSGGGQIYDENTIHNVSFAREGEIRGNNTFNDVTFGGDAFLYSSSTYNNVTMAKQGVINGNNTFNNLSFSAGYTYTLEAGQTQTINTSLTVNGNCGALINILKSSEIGSQATISKASGNVVVSYVTLKDINATGGATFTANNAIDLGNNTGWTINTLPSKNLYWVGNGGNWDDGNHWSLTSGGSPSGCSPTPVDNVFFDANSFSTAGQSVTINVPTAYCNNMNWTGAANNPSIEGTYTSVFKIYGSLTLAAGMAFNFAGDILFEATTTGKTITTAGVPVNTTLRFDGIGGGWTLQDNLSTSLIFLNSGSLSTNSKTVTAYAFYSFSNFTKALTLGSSVVNLTGSFQIWNIDNPATMTLDASTSTIRSTYAVGSQQLFEGGGFTYNDIVFDAGGQIYDDNTIHDVSFGGEGQIRGNNTFHDVTFNDNALLYAPSTYNNVTMAKNGEILYFSNTFNNLSFSPGYTYTLEAGQTQTVGNLCAVGTGALPIRIQSSSVGSPATISKTSGTLCWDYVRISDLNATGGAIFDAGLAPSHTEDLGGNSGFLFTGACTPASCTPCNPPVVTTQPVNSTICAGNNSSFTVAATGDGLTYQWQVNTGSGYSNLSNSAPYTGVTTNSIQITAATNGLNGYQYRCIVNGTCTPSATSNGASLTVNPVPSVTVNSATICVGQTTTLTAAGATTYSWNTGATTSTISVSSGATTSYTVTGTSNGCSANAVATVTVNTLPAVNVNSVTILTGQNAILTATGASSYVWSTGATTNSITVSPAATTSYTVTGTTSGCSNSAVATVTVNAQSVTYYRSRQSGNWNSVNTWQTSTDNATWSNATQVPNYNTVSTIIIQSGHTVTISSTVTFDEVVVNGTLVYPNTGGATLTINNGTGTDLIINGIFEDSRNTAITWSTNATWSMGSNGSLVRTTNTSSANWNSNYDGGISAIPATANWVLRKTGGTNPSLTNTAGMFYPNLIIENNNGGSTWTTAAASSFTGTSVPPVIKGNLNIGGNGTGNVSFLNNNTNSSPVLINGSLTVKAGSTLRSQGTGFEVQGNLVLNGSINYGTSNATFVLSGNSNQTISGTGTIAFRNIRLNKATTAATVALLNPAILSGAATFTSGYLITTATNVLTFSNGSTVLGANTNSFVSGPVRKAGSSAFTFPTGKNGNYQPIAISAPTNAAAAYVAEYFHQDAALGNNTDVTIDSVSDCEYWILNNVGTAYPVSVTLGWNSQSCYVNTGVNTMHLTRWNGTQWGDLGNSSSTLGMITSELPVNSFGVFTLAQKDLSCYAATVFPSESSSINPIIVQSAKSRFYTFQSLFATIKIDLTSSMTAKASKIILWGGTCDNLELLTSDSPLTLSDTTLTITSTTLTPGSYYYLQVIKQNTSPEAKYSLSKTKNIQFVPCTLDAGLGCFASDLFPNACDLICNGGFEGGGTPSNHSEMFLACGWDEGTLGSSDYFRDDGAGIVGVPTNNFGSQTGHIGSSAYAGFFAHVKTIENSTGNVFPDYHEYVYQQLRYPLVAGVTYNVSFWVSRADHTAKAVNTIGAYFSVNDPKTNISTVMPVIPQITCYPTVISDATDWTQIKGSFVATGGEQYIVIGDFGNYDINSTSVWQPGTLFNAPLTPPQISDNLSQQIDPAYYYLDDISVVPNPFNVTSIPATACFGTPFTLNANAIPVSGCVNALSNPNVTWSSVPSATFSPNVGATTSATPLTTGAYIYFGSITYHPGCTETRSVNVTVTAPQVNPISNISISACNVAVPTMSFTSTPAGAIFTWTNSNTAIGLAASGSGNLPSFVPINSSASPVTATISVKATLNGCTGPATTFTITVNPCCVATGSQAHTFVNGNNAVNFYNTYGPTATGANIAFNGTFIVSNNITLVNCEVRLGADAIIHIKSGFTLNITTNSHLSACSNMWDKILIEPGAYLIVDKNSLIEDAKTAVYSMNGGKYLLSSARLNRNYKHMELTAYAGIHPGIITGTNFTCQLIPGGSAANLKPPYTANRTDVGIEINNVDNVRIGTNVGANLNQLTNTFKNMNTGIRSVQSSMTVYNNKFMDMGNGLAPNTGIAAIVAVGDLDAPPNYTARNLIVGDDSPNGLNTITNCVNGVVAFFNMNASVRWNDFSGINAKGVYVFANQQHNNLTIESNKFTSITTQGGVAIHSMNNRSGTNPPSLTRIQFNEINNVNKGAGVLVEELNNQTTGALYVVFNNKISGVQYGVRARNLSNAALNNNFIETRRWINYPQPSIGIEVTGSYGTRVRSNSIKTMPNPTTDTKHGGIYISLSPNSTVNCNITESMGFGIKCAGQMPSDIYNNTIRRNFYGFWLDNNGFIGVQDGVGTAGFPSYNKWVNIPVPGYIATSKRTFTSGGTIGAASPIVYKSNAGVILNPLYDPNPTGTSAASVFTLTPTTNGNPASPSCTIAQFHRSTFSNLLKHAQDIALENISFPGNDANGKWLSKQGLLVNIKTDSIDVSSDGILQTFVNQAAADNMGKLTELNNIINDPAKYNTTDMTAAQVLNASIVPVNDIETNQKLLNDMIISNYLTNTATYTTVQVSALRTLANKCPFTDGLAVYQARVMLSGIDSLGTEYANACETADDASRILYTDALTEDNTALTIYPNPAFGQVTITYIIEPTDEAVIEIYNLIGEKVAMQFLDADATEQTFSVALLNSGVYLYKYSINGKVIKSDKLVIVK
ncbi:MAG: T9SS type A sorting domain-containing protein [Bacteroidia bacterium]